MDGVIAIEPAGRFAERHAGVVTQDGRCARLGCGLAAVFGRSGIWDVKGRRGDLDAGIVGGQHVKRRSLVPNGRWDVWGVSSGDGDTCSRSVSGWKYEATDL